MLGQKKAVIGGDDQSGVFPQTFGVKAVQQPSEILVAHRHQRRVIGADLCDLLGAFLHLLVTRPVQHLSVPTRNEGRLETVGRMERLVRVEAFEHQ